VQAGAAHWPRENVHFERFTSGASPASSVAESQIAPDGPFQVRLQRSGKVLEIPADKSIVDVLRANGIEVPTSCEAGLCGTCRTSYVGGIPDHRDFILSDDERRRVVLVCCARAQSPTLVLDL
jgi:vanillate O-demethylase ferredoxin subunit